MKRRKRAMTLLEMLVCLAIIAVCFVAMTRGIAGLGLFEQQEAEDAALVASVETLLSALEGAPPEAQRGSLDGGWRYETRHEGEAYVLHVYHPERDEAHDFLVREGP